MGDTLALLLGRLIRSNVHATIDLPRIRREHLSLENLGHLDRDTALPHGSWTHDHDHWLAMDLCFGKPAHRPRWNSHHAHPTLPNSLASSSVERRNAVRRP